MSRNVPCVMSHTYTVTSGARTSTIFRVDGSKPLPDDRSAAPTTFVSSLASDVMQRSMPAIPTSSPAYDVKSKTLDSILRIVISSGCGLPIVCRINAFYVELRPCNEPGQSPSISRNAVSGNRRRAMRPAHGGNNLGHDYAIG